MICVKKIDIVHFAPDYNQTRSRPGFCRVIFPLHVLAKHPIVSKMMCRALWERPIFSPAYISYQLKQIHSSGEMQTGLSAQINVCMWFRAKGLEPQTQASSLHGFDIELVFECILNHSAILPKGVCYGVLCQNGSLQLFCLFILNITHKTQLPYPPMQMK